MAKRKSDARKNAPETKKEEILPPKTEPEEIKEPEIPEEVEAPEEAEAPEEEQAPEIPEEAEIPEETEIPEEAEAPDQAPAPKRKNAFVRAIGSFSEKKLSVPVWTALLGLLCVLLAVALFVVSITAMNVKKTAPAPKDPDKVVAIDRLSETGDVNLVSQAPKGAEDALSIHDMISSVEPSLVCISVTHKDGSTGVASGIIVDASGYVLTNYHVIEPAAEKTGSVLVYTSDGGSYEAETVGADTFSDIAILRISPEGELVAATLGDSALTQQGDWVVALGTPGGKDLFCTATVGIVSGTGRQIPVKTPDGNAAKIFTVIQTDAAVNPGNSGGPLVNVYGQVIGVTGLKLSEAEYEGVGFALPINGVIEIANQLIATGEVSERPESDFVTGSVTFGVKSFEYFSQKSAQENGLVPGAYVKVLASGGPAETAGIQMGDIITVFDGKEVKALSDITDVLAAKSPGDVITVQVNRNRTELSFEVTLAEYAG